LLKQIFDQQKLSIWKPPIGNPQVHKNLIIDNHSTSIETPTISIITPTFNRAEELEPLIKSIQNQSLDHQKFEMIIVDDGSIDTTEEIIREWKNKVDFNLRYVSQENKGPGAARNLGMSVATGDLFLFIDSDCEAKEDWVEQIYETYQTDKFDACGGPDASKDDFTPLQRAIDFSMTSFFTTGGMRGHSNKPFAKFYPRSHNMGITKSIYKKVGGFGKLRHGQDIELSHRIINSGAKVSYIPDAVVYHRRRTTVVKFFRQVFNWGVARINLGKIDRVMLEPIHFLPAIITVIFFLLMIAFIINPAQNGKIFSLGFGLLLALSLLGGVKQQSVKVGILLIIIIPIQIIGYGLGFLISLFRRFVLNLDPWTGFSRKYYN